MYVMMPVNVMSKACIKCSRFQIIATKEYKGSQIEEVDLECKYYDDCLNALDMWQRGQTEEELKKNDELG